MLPIRARSVFVAVALTALPARVFAQQSPVEDGATVRGEGPTPRTAGQISLPLGSLGLVPRTDPTEVLTLVPGVSLTNEANVGDAPEVFMRGFAGDNGSDEQFTVNGVPLNEESNTLTHGYADTLFLMPEIVQRLDVVQGLADPRQGNFALAGSIDFGLGLSQRGLSFRASYGTAGYVRIAGFHGPALLSRETFVATDYTHSDGFGPQRAYDRWSTVAQHVFDLGSSGWRARLMGVGYVSQWQIPGFVRSDECPAGHCPDATFFGVHPGLGPQRGDSARVLVSGALEWQSPLERVVLRVYGQLRDFRESANADGFLADPEHGDGLSERYGGGTVGLNGFYRRIVRIGSLVQEIEVGFSVRHDRYTLREEHLDATSGQVRSPPDADDRTAVVRVTNPSVYADLTVRPASWLSLRGGLRVDAMAYDVDRTQTDDTESPANLHADAFGLHAGPKATLAVGPFRGVQLLASFGTGFRSPDARTVTDAGPVPFTVATTEDLSLRYTLPARRGRPAISAALTGFHTTVDHDEIFDPTVADEVPVGPTDRLGALIWARIEPLPWIDVLASIAYTHSTVEQDALEGSLRAGSAIPYLPSWVARLDAGLDHPIAHLGATRVDLRAAIGAGFRGSEGLILTDGTAATFLLDASVGVRIGPVAFDLSGRNLTDARWHAENFEFASNFNPGTTGSTTPVPTFAAGAPLAVFGTLSLYPWH